MGAIRTTFACILILVSAAVSAADCVTGVRELSSITSVPNLVAGPIAWSGTVLAVAKTQDGAPGALWVGIYGEGMETVAVDRLVATNARTLYATVWTGTEFGIFYRTDASGFNLQRVTMMGEPIGPPVAITPNRPTLPGDEVEVQWSAIHDAYVVAHFVTSGSARGVYVTMLERGGAQRSDRSTFVTPFQNSPLALAVTDGGAIGVLYVSVGENVVLTILRGSNDVPATQQIALGSARELEATVRGEQFIVVRSVLTTPREVRWLITNTFHQVVQADALLFSAPDDDVRPTSVVVTPEEIAIAYVNSRDPLDTLDDRYRLRRLTSSGVLIGDVEFAASDNGAGRALSPFAFVWTGESYITAGVRVAPGRLSSYLVRFCPLRVEISAPQRVSPGEVVTFSPAASGGVPGYSYEWSFSHQAAVQKGPGVVSVQRTFTTYGTYTATVTVIDATGLRAKSTFTFEVVKSKRRAVRP